MMIFCFCLCVFLFLVRSSSNSRAERGRSAGGARAERGRSAGGARKRSGDNFLMIPFALCETTATHAPLQTTGRTARPSGVSRSCRGRVEVVSCCVSSRTGERRAQGAGRKVLTNQRKKPLPLLVLHVARIHHHARRHTCRTAA